MTELHRVTWVDPAWQRLEPHDPFHPLHVPVDRQGHGRFDNPHRYAALYLATTARAAVGETFGNLSRWPKAEIERPREDRPRCLVRYTLIGDRRPLDLDDPAALARLDLRPSDVVRRNRDRTQEIALTLFEERRDHGTVGLRWWSYWRPEWAVVMLWSDGISPPRFPDVSVESVEPLTVDHPAVRVAADRLPRELGT